MIRDPSDGSVKAPEEINPKANEINEVSAKPSGKEITSGLPPLAGEKSSQLGRLNRSREWLRDYHQRKSVPTTKTGEP